MTIYTEKVYLLGIMFLFSENEGFYFSNKISFSFSKSIYELHINFLEKELGDFLKASK